jgi:hypothetical protein
MVCAGKRQPRDSKYQATKSQYVVLPSKFPTVNRRC